MNTLLKTAIEGRRQIHLLYEGKSRNVEPYALGLDSNGDEVVVGRQVAPWVPLEKSWQVFRLKKIYGLLILDLGFEPRRESPELPAELISGLRLGT